MYESFYQLHDRPFTAGPRADRYFPAAAIEDARERLASVIERSAGPGMVVGPTGSGKTVLLHVLAEQFRDQLAIVQLESARLCTRRALLQAILFELGLPYRDLDEGALRLSLIDHLSPSEACPNGMLLLVDEAHTLPQRLLEEIRMITNLVRDGRPRVRLVLAGSAALEEQFAHPKFESFNQRIAMRCYLEPFDADDTRRFVMAQVAASGGRPEEIFNDGALSAIHRATDGIPRLINQLCDHALVLGFANGTRLLSSAQIDEAWADLQQLPPPWSAEKENLNTNQVIEFGALDEEPPEAGALFGEDSPGEANPTPEPGEIVPPAECEPSVESRWDEIKDEVEMVEFGQIADEFGQISVESDDGPAAVSFPIVGPDPDVLEALNDTDTEAPCPTDREPAQSWADCGSTDNSAEHESMRDIAEFEPDGPSCGDEPPLAIDPFDEPFEDEELIIDDMATLGDAGLDGRKRVESAYSTLLAAALSQAQLPLMQALPSPATDLCDEGDDALDNEPFDALDNERYDAAQLDSSLDQGDPITYPIEAVVPEDQLPESGDDLQRVFRTPADYDPVLPEPEAPEDMPEDALEEMTSKRNRPVEVARSKNRPVENESTEGLAAEFEPNEKTQQTQDTGADAANDLDILVIEDEPVRAPGAAATVLRRPYYQLMSSLRRG